MSNVNVDLDAPTSPVHAPQRRWLVLWVALVVGLGSVFVYGGSADHHASAIALGLIIAAASFGSASLLGFLFGVPRRSDEGAMRLAYLPNTNLEQVSDWLTKLLLGATLTQVGNLTDWFGDLFGRTGKSLGGAGGATFSGALCIYFGSAGFLAGWLVTRLYLGRMMQRADEQLQTLLKAADAAEEAGQTRVALEIRAATADSQRSLGVSGWSGSGTYERLRSTEPPGTQRTRLMEQEVSKAKRKAIEAGESLSRSEVVEMFDNGAPGQRITALAYMEARWDLIDIDCVAKAIREPASAFEQYHALVIALQWLNGSWSNDEGGRNTIREALNVALASGRFDNDSSRRSLADRIRALLGDA